MSATVAPSTAKAPKAKAPTKRTTAPKAKATAPADITAAESPAEVAAIAAPMTTALLTDEHGVLVRRDDESDESYIVRLSAVADMPNITAATALLTDADRDAAVTGFETRIHLSFMAGHLMKGAATLQRQGAAVTSFDDVSAALNVSAKGGGRWMGRRYSTMRECYDIATVHSTDRRESYLATFRLATVSDEYPEGEHAPEQLREYLTWARQDAKGAKTAAKNTMAALVAKRATARAAAARTEVKRVEKTDRLAAIVDAGTVDGCPLTADQWADLGEQTLTDMAQYAQSLASALGAARREEERAAEKAEKAARAAAETGPAPAVAPRVTVNA